MDSAEKKTKTEDEESNKERRVNFDGNMDTPEGRNSAILQESLAQESKEGATDTQDDKYAHKEHSKAKKPFNTMLHPVQRSRKRSREKKRREGISAAMKELHEILARINMEESRRIHMPTTHLHHDSNLTREETTNMLQSIDAAPNVIGYHQLGQREIIIDAVNTLSHLHSENERNKTEILQLTASLLSMQQTTLTNTAILPTMDATLNSLIPSAQFRSLEQAHQDQVFATASFPQNPNLYMTSQAFSSNDDPSKTIADQQYGAALEHMHSSSLMTFATLPQRLLDDALDRTDESSTDLIDALSNIDSFEKG